MTNETPQRVENDENRRGIPLRVLLAGLAVLGMLCGSCVLGGACRLRHGDLELARGVTGLPLPEYAAIDICTDTDMTTGYHLHADEGLVAAVMAERRPLREDVRHDPMLLILSDSCMPPPPSPSRLVYAAGCREHQAWVALLDPVTRELWLEVHYPDFGGDGPPCPPGTERPAPTPTSRDAAPSAD